MMGAHFWIGKSTGVDGSTSVDGSSGVGGRTGVYGSTGGDDTPTHLNLVNSREWHPDAAEEPPLPLGVLHGVADTIIPGMGGAFE